MYTYKCNVNVNYNTVVVMQVNTNLKTDTFQNPSALATYSRYFCGTAN